MRLEYKNVSVTYEAVTNNIYKLDSTNNFIIEIHKIGGLDDEKNITFDAVLEFSDSVNQELLSKSLYVSKGICVYDKNPIGISFGGLIGKFHVPPTHHDLQVDKDVDRVAYFYLIKQN
jgi:hypothetical protein